MGTPDPFNAMNPDDELDDVSCGASTFCVAVGDSYNVDNNTGSQIGAQWNGSSWGQIGALTPSPGGAHFLSQRCVMCLGDLVHGGGHRGECDDLRPRGRGLERRGVGIDDPTGGGARRGATPSPGVVRPAPRSVWPWTATIPR